MALPWNIFFDISKKFFNYQLDLHDKELDVAGWGKLETDGNQAQVQTRQGGFV
jgi:hypothetical protein